MEKQMQITLNQPKLNLSIIAVRRVQRITERYWAVVI